MLFVVLVAYPVVWLWLGIYVRHRARLPVRGPAIIAANHNSHLDILALLSLFPLLAIPQVQPAAATDYFFRTWWLRWFARYVIGIIPVVRGGRAPGHLSDDADPLTECYEALAAGKVLVIFPEGTRGEPEQMGELKSGIWFLAQRFPAVPVVPVYLYGLGKAMPRGTFVPTPFFVQVAVGRALPPARDKAAFMDNLRGRFEHLKHQIYHPAVDED